MHVTPAIRIEQDYADTPAARARLTTALGLLRFNAQVIVVMRHIPSQVSEDVFEQTGLCADAFGQDGCATLALYPELAHEKVGVHAALKIAVFDSDTAKAWTRLADRFSAFAV